MNEKVAQTFEKDLNFLSCIGSMDGKHITIQAAINSGPEFYNYKQNISVLLMALVDAEYCFMFADCDFQGRLSDGTVFQNNLRCPPLEEPLIGQNKPVPYVLAMTHLD